MNPTNPTNPEAHDSESRSPDVTRWLVAWSAGDQKAVDRLMPWVIEDLRRVARAFMKGQAQDHTLEPNALINEAYLRLTAQEEPPQWKNRYQFFSYAASIMRRILINHAEQKGSAKRGGGEMSLGLELADLLPVEGSSGGEEGSEVEPAHLIDLDRALDRLAELDPRQGRIVELRFFLGLTIDETAEALELSPRTVKREWRLARMWLGRALAQRDRG